MGASITHLYNYMEVRFSAAGSREDVSSHLLSSRRKTSAIGFLCKLYIRRTMLRTTPEFLPHSYFCHTYMRDMLLMILCHCRN